MNGSHFQAAAGELDPVGRVENVGLSRQILNIKAVKAVPPG